MISDIPVTDDQVAGLVFALAGVHDDEFLADLEKTCQRRLSTCFMAREGEEIELDANWFCLSGGVSAEELLLGALTKLDEQERDRWQRDLDQAEALAGEWVEQGDDQQLQACVQQARQFRQQIQAMLVLAQMDEVTLNPIFGLTDALGSVMRKKLKPLTDPLLRHIDALLN